MWGRALCLWVRDECMYVHGCVYGCVSVCVCQRWTPVVFHHVGVSVCTHVCLCTWVCACVHMCVCVHERIHVCLCTCVHMHFCTWVCALCTCVYMGVHMYVHVCLCTWACTCVHGHVHASDSLAHVCTEAEVDAVPSSIASPFHFLSQCFPGNLELTASARPVVQ